MLTNGYRIVDQYFVQGVSVAAQAAVSASVFVLILFYAAFELVAAGAGPLIARATGAGDLERRRRLLGQSLSAVLVQSALLMAIGVAAAPAIAVGAGPLGGTGRGMQPLPDGPVRHHPAARASPRSSIRPSWPWATPARRSSCTPCRWP